MSLDQQLISLAGATRSVCDFARIIVLIMLPTNRFIACSDQFTEQRRIFLPPVTTHQRVTPFVYEFTIHSELRDDLDPEFGSSMYQPVSTVENPDRLILKGRGVLTHCRFAFERIIKIRLGKIQSRINQKYLSKPNT